MTEEELIERAGDFDQLVAFLDGYLPGNVVMPDTDPTRRQISRWCKLDNPSPASATLVPDEMPVQTQGSYS